MTGMSGVKDGAFQIDVGAKYVGAPKYRQDYLCAGASIKLPFGNAPFLCYQGAQTIELTDGEQEYIDGLADYEQGLLDYEQALIDLPKAEQEIRDGWVELEEGRKEAAEKLAEAKENS